MVCKSKTELSPDSRCNSPAGPKHLALRIVPHAWKSSDTIFGVAFLSESGTGAYGDVFYDSVEKLYRDWGVSLPRVLGHVMAHELGHLLLGSNGHSRDGIMRPSWHGNDLQRASKGSLLFSPEQAKSMRDRLSRKLFSCCSVLEKFIKAADSQFCTMYQTGPPTPGSAHKPSSG